MGTVMIAISSAGFGGPALAAARHSGHIAQLVESAAFESWVLVLLGAGFLTVASAIRRLQTPIQ